MQLLKAAPRLSRPSGSISAKAVEREADKKLSDICWGGAQLVNSAALRGVLPLLTHRRLMRAILLPAPWIICQYLLRLCRKLPVYFHWYNQEYRSATLNALKHVPILKHICLIPFSSRFIQNGWLRISYFNILSAELRTPFSFRSSESKPAHQS